MSDQRAPWQIALDTINKYVVRPTSHYSPTRLRDELGEIERCFGARILLFSPNDEWHAWGVRLPYRGVTMTVRYHQHHPYEAPLVFLDPAPKNRHYYIHKGESVARLCWCQPTDWQPSFRLIVAAGSAIRFLNEYANGKAT
jgi:hypothetical protein